MKSWKILSAFDTDLTYEIEFTCMNCGADALLPVKGTVIAQVHMSIIGDRHTPEMPDEIQCPTCRKKYVRSNSLERAG